MVKVTNVYNNGKNLQKVKRGEKSGLGGTMCEACLEPDQR